MFLPNERPLLFILRWRNTKICKTKDFLPNTILKLLMLSKYFRFRKKMLHFFEIYF